jgi:hypothetical protein
VSLKAKLPMKIDLLDKRIGDTKVLSCGSKQYQSTMEVAARVTYRDAVLSRNKESAL